MGLNFERIKLMQHFKHANARDACRVCAHVKGTAPATGYQCMKGGFFVTAYAICDAFERKPVGAAQ